VVVEWESGSGQVLAVGMHNFRFDASEVNQNLTRFARNIFRYLSAPLIVNLSLESDSPATQQGAGYLGEHYGAGGVVAEAGQGITAVISGKAWKKLDLIATGRTPSATKTEHVSFTPGQNFSVKLHLDAKGLQPGEYTAGVELAQGEDIIASAERKFFLIPKSEETGPVDKHWIWEVRSEKISAEIDKGTGVVWGLHDPSDPKPVQFAANPDNLPALATAEHRWLGDLGLKFRFEGDKLEKHVHSSVGARPTGALEG
jgi:hypothetical protein